MALPLVPSDSTQAMASLMTAYGDDEGEDDRNTSGISEQPGNEAAGSPDSKTQQPGFNFISDDDDAHHSSQGSGSDHQDDKPSSTDPEKAEENTKSLAKLSPAEQRRPQERTATRLVSYGPDEVDEADDDDDSGESLPSVFNLQNIPGSMSRVGSLASVTRVDADAIRTASQSPASINEDDIQLPSEPPGNCSKRLQEKIAKHHARLRQGEDLNAKILALKEFRNPSIYEKLIKMCGIDEQGTNYPPELYNPLIFGPQSYYDELARIQTEMLHEKEKEAKKSKVEFQKGVKKSAPSTDTAAAPDVKRKISKWDVERGGGGGTAASTNSTSTTTHASAKPK